MEAIDVPDWSSASGRTIGEISPAQNHRVQIAGIRRGEGRMLNPGATLTKAKVGTGKRLSPQEKARQKKIREKELRRRKREERKKS